MEMATDDIPAPYVNIIFGENQKGVDDNTLSLMISSFFTRISGVLPLINVVIFIFFYIIVLSLTPGVFSFTTIVN